MNHNLIIVYPIVKIKEKFALFAEAAELILESIGRSESMNPRNRNIDKNTRVQIFFPFLSFFLLARLFLSLMFRM